MVRWFRRGAPSPVTPSLSSETHGSRRAGTQGAAVLPRSSTPEEQRFAQVYAADRVGPMPYPNQASPDVGAARGRVRQLVGDLVPHAVDEGTGAALDPLIASWTSGWLARVDSQHADHQAVIDRLVGGARQQLAEAEAAHERDRRALEIARRDYTDAREALLEPVAEPDPAPADVADEPLHRPSRHTTPPLRDQGPPEPATGPLPVHRPADVGRTP